MEIMLGIMFVVMFVLILLALEFNTELKEVQTRLKRVEQDNEINIRDR